MKPIPKFNITKIKPINHKKEKLQTRTDHEHEVLDLEATSSLLKL